MKDKPLKPDDTAPQALVIGGGPAGLMAAESLLTEGLRTELIESASSVARKFLIAGKGGLNLTHSEHIAQFVARYRERSSAVGEWLAGFDPAELRQWAADLGVETVVGSSGRVFPADFKAGPMLRRWVRRLRAQGLKTRTGVRFAGWTSDGQVRLIEQGSERHATPKVIVLALGGSSWSKLGASGAWVDILRDAGVDVAELRPSNCGFDYQWSDVFRQRYAGQAVKQVTATLDSLPPLRGEFMLTEHGVEGSLIYALSAPMRDQLAATGQVQLSIDLAPDRKLDALTERLSRDRGSRSWSEFLRRQIGLKGSRYGLLRELGGPWAFSDATTLAHKIKNLPLVLHATRPIDEAISCAGGVRFEAMTDDGMLIAKPGVWCAGEMIDWEAPTGGYLLSACFASGRCAGLAAARWAQNSGPTAVPLNEPGDA